MNSGGRGQGAEADSKTLAKPIKRDKLDEIFQAQKLGRSNNGSYELLQWAHAIPGTWSVRVRVVVGITW